MKNFKRGGIRFFRIGRFGGSFYVSKPKPMPLTVANLTAYGVNLDCAVKADALLAK